jgi:hypothetical protein
MKFKGKGVLAALVFAVVLTAGPLWAMERAEFINGSQWTQWSNQDKLVYIRGLCNWADFITQAQVQSKKNYEFCISKVFVDQLKTKTLGQVVEQVDAYYQENPSNLNNSVVEVMLQRCTNVCPR